MITITNCPICGKSAFKPFLETTDYTLTKETFALVECSTCQFVITSPRPEDKDLGKYYQSNDYISHTSKATSLGNVLYLIARKFTMRSKKKLATKLSPNKGRILDIGCGTGDFLETCKNEGWKTVGVEPSSIAGSQAKAKGIEIIDDLNRVTGKFKLITLWHVLEHIPNLGETLHTIHSLLEEDGKLVIAVPNHLSEDGKKYKNFWAGYDVPRHLWHFNQRTMNQLLQKNQFILKETIPLKLDSFYVSLLSESYLGKKLTRYLQAFIMGIVSNRKAKTNKEYSSLIYIATK